ncbi:MAG: leucyl/phenylalanyl-tRNA--protein transferase [Bacteroidetes bacterium]|nr:leucyl/phenylalanyl-tRNA--protein transferase [Bacteroidota bacterium]
MYLLSEDIVFPPVEEADEDGFLAIGGDLSTERLLEAYRNGIFPWYNEDEPICWWSPDPRCVLFPQKLHVSKSMNQLIRKGQFRFSMDTCFTEVMENCRSMARKGEQGSWIQDELIAAYTKLHELGYAHSGETWYDGKLVGGMYGVQLGKIFFGESMFSFMSNASKFALTGFVKELVKQDVQLIDCQMKTDHLLSLGAEMIPRSEFIAILRQYI